MLRIMAVPPKENVTAKPPTISAACYPLISRRPDMPINSLHRALDRLGYALAANNASDEQLCPFLAFSEQD
jgi:hypothetical protein